MTKSDAFRDWPKRADYQPSKREFDARQIMTDTAQILDVVKREWGEVGSWSEWDQGVRERITAWLRDHYADFPNPPFYQRNDPA